MPYTNVPPDLQDKMDKCVQQVQAQGHDKQSAIAICYTSVVEGKALPEGVTVKADYPWDQCMRDQMARYGDEETARKICGAIRQGKTIEQVEMELGIAPRVAARTGPLDWVRVLAGHLTKAGARHSKADNEIIQDMHDKAVQLGADCPTKAMYQQASRSGGAFAVFKAADGPRWIGVVSNNYRDLQGEIITEDAHREYLSWLDANPGSAPELWSWHTPGTARKAWADWWALTDGGFVWMSGPLTEEEAGQFKAGEVLGMSHGFYAVKAGADIVRYRSFEVSELPLQAAANVWTQFGVKEDTMAFEPEKRAFLSRRFGEAFVAELEQQDEQRAKTLKDSGVEFKGVPAPAVQATVAQAKQEPGEMPEAPAGGGSPADIIGQCMQICGQCATVCLQCAAACSSMNTPAARKCAEDCTKCASACRTCADSCAAVMQEMAAPAAGVPVPAPAPAPVAAAMMPAPQMAARKDDEEVKAQEQAALREALAGAIQVATGDLQKQVAQLVAQVEALKASDDAKIAQALAPRVAPQRSVISNETQIAPSQIPAGAAAALKGEEYDWLRKALAAPSQ